MTRSPPRSPLRSRSRRGFALPLVVLLALVSSLTLIVLLERHGVSHRTVERQIDGYRGHHRAAGIQECVNRWLTTTRARAGGSLVQTGLAFELALPGGEQIRVSMEDGQGTALIDDTSLTGERRAIVRRMREYLESLPPELTHQTTRTVGPAEISIARAPAVVIEALIVATVEERRRERALEAILGRRAADMLTQEELPRALSDAGLEDAERDRLLSMLVEAPTIWLVVADLVDRRGELAMRNAGLMEWRFDARSDPFSQAGQFLTWEDVPLDEEGLGGVGPGAYAGSPAGR